MAEPSPAPEWAMKRARYALLTLGRPPFPPTLEAVAAELAAARREAIEECAARVAAMVESIRGEGTGCAGGRIALRQAGHRILALADKAPS